MSLHKADIYPLLFGAGISGPALAGLELEYSVFDDRWFMDVGLPEYRKRIRKPAGKNKRNCRDYTRHFCDFFQNWHAEETSEDTSAALGPFHYWPEELPSDVIDDSLDYHAIAIVITGVLGKPNQIRFVEPQLGQTVELTQNEIRSFLYCDLY